MDDYPEAAISASKYTLLLVLVVNQGGVVIVHTHTVIGITTQIGKKWSKNNFLVGSSSTAANIFLQNWSVLFYAIIYHAPYLRPPNILGNDVPTTILNPILRLQNSEF